MNTEQRDLIARFEGQSAFDFMNKEEVRANAPQEFLGLWERNVRWLEDVATQLRSMVTPYKNKHWRPGADCEEECNGKGEEDAS